MADLCARNREPDGRNYWRPKHNSPPSSFIITTITIISNGHEKDVCSSWLPTTDQLSLLERSGIDCGFPLLGYRPESPQRFDRKSLERCLLNTTLEPCLFNIVSISSLIRLELGFRNTHKKRKLSTVRVPQAIWSHQILSQSSGIDFSPSLDKNNLLYSLGFYGRRRETERSQVATLCLSSSFFSFFAFLGFDFHLGFEPKQ